jgi:hypothetical protein
MPGLCASVPLWCNKKKSGNLEPRILDATIQLYKIVKHEVHA